MSESKLVAFSPGSSGFGGPDAPAAAQPRLSGAAILVDGNDHVGVRMACDALAEDFGRVTKGPPSVVRAVEDNATTDDTDATPAEETVIIVGSLASSGLIRTLVDRGQLRVDGIRGKWESFCTAVVERPACAPRFRTALVIAGSDKRGTIFGVYTLSEQIGVSPWYWWADVPPKHHPDIFALPMSTVSKEPSVKYRGIFINDEAPALTGFVLEKFGCYGRAFYARVFELLLRLKANFLWPAMWPGYPNPGSSFFVDDGGTNAALADAYGIVVSTSHHEPMQRATNEWFADHADGSWAWPANKAAITRFFAEGVERARAAESYFTMGMRGEYDKSMQADDPAAVVADVLATQRALIKQAHGREDAVPQLLALYKEVQEYWDAGRLDVPDDVTLLFADDNFGTCRRLPSGDEAKRSGGAGIYYHFEYVGAPRSYKWINANSLGKTWHQLQEAHRRNARQIWVFNVGDIKPMEVPLSLAMSLAWDIDSIDAGGIAGFLDRLSLDMFGYAGTPTIGEAWREHDRLVSLRRHEHLEAGDYSLLHYNEADSILERWESLLRRVETISEALEEEYQAAFFQLVLHPVKASTIYTSLRVHQARNQLWAEQRRNSANTAARKVLDLFDADYALSEEFHALEDGKWQHMMRQTHYGYGPTWHAPSRDMISGLCFVQARQDSNPLVGQLGVAVEGHAGVRPGRCNEESDRTRPSRRDLVPGFTLPALTPYHRGPAARRWFDIYTRGTPALAWTAAAPADSPWVRLSRRAGRLTPGGTDARVHVWVDWDRVPDGFDGEVLIDVRSTGGAYGPYGDDFEQVRLPVANWRVGPGFDGWVETNGYISIPAAEYRTDAPPAAFYQVLADTGRMDAGSLAVRAPAPALTSGGDDDDAPFALYDVYVRHDTPTARLCLEFAMTLDVDPADPMQYDVQVDERPPHRHRLVPEPDASARPGELPRGWATAVQDGVWKRQHELGALTQGAHRIGVRLRHTNMLLEKLVVDLGAHRIGIRLRHTNMLLEKLLVDLGVAEGSYLGPPTSRRVTTPACSAGA